MKEYQHPCPYCSGTGQSTDKELVYNDNFLVTWKFGICRSCMGKGLFGHGTTQVPKKVTLDQVAIYAYDDEIQKFKNLAGSAYEYERLFGIGRVATVEF